MPHQQKQANAARFADTSNEMWNKKGHMTLYCLIQMCYSKDLAIMHASTLLLGHHQCVLWFLTNTADVIVGVLQ